MWRHDGDMHALVHVSAQCKLFVLKSNSREFGMGRERLKIYPGVTHVHLGQAIRNFVERQRISDLAQGMQELLHITTKMAPRLSIMIKYSGMIIEVLKHAKNGVVGHCALKRGLEDMCMLVPGVKQPKTIVLELSAGIRYLLAWFREYGKGWYGYQKKAGDVYDKLSKVESPAQRKIMETVMAYLDLSELKERKKGDAKFEPFSDAKLLPLQDAKFEPLQDVKLEPLQNAKFEPLQDAKFEPLQDAKLGLQDVKFEEEAKSEKDATKFEEQDAKFGLQDAKFEEQDAKFVPLQDAKFEELGLQDAKFVPLQDAKFENELTEVKKFDPLNENVQPMPITDEVRPKFSRKK